MARSEQTPVKITLLHVIAEGARDADRVRANQIFKYVTAGINYPNLETRIVQGHTVVESVLEQAEGYDLIVVGATREPLFKNLLMGNTSQQIADRAQVTVIMVKRRSGPLHSLLRKTVLERCTSTAKGEQVKDEKM